MNEAIVRKVLDKYLTEPLVNMIMNDIKAEQAEGEEEETLQVTLETTITIGR